MDVSVTYNNDLMCSENQLRQEVGDLRQEVNVDQPAGGDSSFSVTAARRSDEPGYVWSRWSTFAFATFGVFCFSVFQICLLHSLLVVSLQSRRQQNRSPASTMEHQMCWGQGDGKRRWRASCPCISILINIHSFIHSFIGVVADVPQQSRNVQSWLNWG